MQKSRSSWLSGQAFRLGRTLTGVAIGCGRGAVDGAKGLSRLAGECAVQFLEGARTQKAEMNRSSKEAQP